jgi:RNA polymerase sigma factor (TIGR02999 family)
MERVYRELRSMASQRLRGERGDHTLQPTALVHEAFLRLVDQRQLDWRSRSQFFDLAGRMMRRILVDHARHRARVKRGGDVKIVTLERPDRLPAHLAGDDVLALDEALHRLARHDSRKARIVELHFFAGLSVVETAEVLGCSKATVSRDWRFAKAWIGKALTAVGSRAAGRAPGDDANAGAEARRGA